MCRDTLANGGVILPTSLLLLKLSSFRPVIKLFLTFLKTCRITGPSLSDLVFQSNSQIFKMYALACWARPEERSPTKKIFTYSRIKKLFSSTFNMRQGRDEQPFSALQFYFVHSEVGDKL